MLCLVCPTDYSRVCSVVQIFACMCVLPGLSLMELAAMPPSIEPLGAAGAPTRSEGYAVIGSASFLCSCHAQSQQAARGPASRRAAGRPGAGRGGGGAAAG